MFFKIRCMAVVGMSAVTFGCDSPDVTQPPQFAQSDLASLKQTGKFQDICQAWDQKIRSIPATETRRGQAAIMAAVVANTDPSVAAEKAAKSNQWGLIRTYTMMGTEPFGVDCTDAKQLYQGQPLVRAYRVYSDVAGSCETFGARGDCAVEGKLDNFAVKYNRALVARNDYPYRDICRIPQNGQPRMPDTATARNDSRLGFPVLADPDHPRTFPEAARRGNSRALAAMLASDPQAVNRLDGYGMSPLQWAVQYGQGKAVDWLLSHGALPDGGACGYLRASAFHMALSLKHEEIADRIYAAIPTERRGKAWTSQDIYVAAVGGSTGFLKRMLREPHDGINGDTPRDGQTFSPDAERILADYREKLCWNSPIPQNARVTLVTVYSGDRSTAEGLLERDVGSVTVVVSKKDAPQFLVLSAYDETDWHIQAQKGVKITGVFINSYHKQNIHGLDGTVPVVQNWIHDQCKANVEHATSGREGKDLEKLQRAVQSVLRRRIDRTIANQNRVEI